MYILHTQLKVGVLMNILQVENLRKEYPKFLLEDISFIPIICISNYHIDKKIKELMIEQNVNLTYN